MGRKKIEMKMVKDSNARQVTFSKRRSGLFKKANELATLCAAEVAILVFSPGGKPFSFGHPSVDFVTQRFLNKDSSDATPPSADSHVAAQQDSANVEKLNQQLTELLKQLQIEKKRGRMLDSGITKEQRKPISELGFDELVKMKTSLEELRENVKLRLNEMEASSSLLLLKKAPGEEADDNE